VHYSWDFSFLWQYRTIIAIGLGFTVLYALGTILAGLIVGFAVGIARLAQSRIVNYPLIAYIEAFRCTPLLVQLIWFYYAFPVIVGLDIPAHVAAGMTLSLYTGAFYAEIIRGGVNSIERGQWDAARAIGMRRGQVMRRVILPQAIKRMIPPFMNQSITQLKNTSLVSTIAVSDLLYQGEIITATTYRPLEVYTSVAIIYFGVLFPLTLLAQLVEKRLAASD
jgi:polar amino acid transport system permease protein